MNEDEKIKKEIEKQIDEHLLTHQYLKNYTKEIAKVIKMAKKEFAKPFGGINITDLNCVICGKKTESVIMPKPITPDDLKSDEKLFHAMQRCAMWPIPICDGHTQKEIEEEIFTFKNLKDFEKN